MTTRFPLLCLLALCFASALPFSRALAQAAPPPLARPAPPPPPWEVQPAPSLEAPTLGCPECDCDRARREVAALRAEYRLVHAKVSTKAARLQTLIGFAGAGGVAGGMAWLYLMSIPGNSTPERERERQRRFLGVGAAGVVIPLSVGFAGLMQHGKKLEAGAPFQQRDLELRLALREARLVQRDACRRARP